MKNIIFLLLFTTAFTSTRATNYYFSSVSGDDLRTPAQAKNPSTPWKTLDKLNSFFGSLNPGDSVLLKKGETFFGSIIVTKSGTSNQPIVIGTYGSGSKPVITGFVSLTWSSAGRNIYESQVLTPAHINVVTVNGYLAAMGRYPNSGYLILESHSGTASITDNELTGTPNWTGAELVLRRRRWILDRDSITNHQGNTIFYTAANAKAEPYDKYGYFIQNSPLTLDAQNEWYYNPSTHKMLIYSETKPANVKAVAVENLIQSTGNSYINFDNLVLSGSNKNGISLGGGSNFNITNCNILFTGTNGISDNTSYSTIENCTVENSLNIGIQMPSHHNAVRNNLIRNISLLPGMGASGENNGIGIHSLGNNNTFEFNKIQNTGYSGIFFGGTETVVKNNYIDSFCLNKDDGAGIYTNKAPSTKIGRKIIGNIITNGIGASLGGRDNNQQASGIYIDFASDVEITNNVVMNCNLSGIYIHSGSRITIQNNTLFNNFRQLLMIQKTSDPIRNNTITQNILFSKLPTQTVSNLKSDADDTELFGTFDNNYYARPSSNRIAVYNNHLNNANAGSELQGWKAISAQDEVSVSRNAVAVNRQNTSGNQVRMEYNPTSTTKTVSLDGTYVDVKNNEYSNRITLQPYTSVILMKK